MKDWMRGSVALAIYIASIVLANVMTAWWGLVPVGFGLVVTAGTYAAGFALLARDFVHRYAGMYWALGGIAVGAALSWFLSTPAIALASAAAFLIAELIDMGVYLWLRPKGFVRAAFTSNVIAAPVDTVAFLWIAGFPLTWESVLGQFLGKIVWATIVPLFLYVLVRGNRKV